ncbi:hypothetical protein ACWT_5672 [Actinoplanes sp. SE50]|nr:hypothetical protein ACPL_5802 [Actinoplanes sp. SE50/110]ATO85087.1 hypothetical protein ACWT_5672 [Actinoplanes sp. SE50]SLM02498.1 hypothetical protein ACSP50_5748 [Actinoplanes sp. SE50/110]
MTAAVKPIRPSAGPCNSGTVLGEVTAPCGRPDTRPYPGGPRREAHKPQPQPRFRAVKAEAA